MKLMTPEQYAVNGKSEHAQQTALFMWAALEANRYPILRLLYAIPNGGSRGGTKEERQRIGGQLKAEGVKAGFPDVGFPVARQGYHGLFIEMKRPGGDGKRAGTLGKEQRDFWHPELMAQGFLVQTIYSFADARACLCWYVGIS